MRINPITPKYNYNSPAFKSISYRQAFGCPFDEFKEAANQVDKLAAISSTPPISDEERLLRLSSLQSIGPLDDYHVEVVVYGKHNVDIALPFLYAHKKAVFDQEMDDIYLEDRVGSDESLGWYLKNIDPYRFEESIQERLGTAPGKDKRWLYVTQAREIIDSYIVKKEK